MLIKKLSNYKSRSLEIEDWEKLEEELEKEGYVIEFERGIKFSEMLRFAPEEIVEKHSKVTAYKITRDGKGTWVEKKGALIVYTTSYLTSRIEKYIPNAPKAIYDSDINIIEIYKTEEGYFEPATWQLFEDYEVQYRVNNNTEDGATFVRIKRKDPILKLKVTGEYFEKNGVTIDLEELGEIVLGRELLYDTRTNIAEMECDYRIGDWEFSNVLLKFMVIPEKEPKTADELLNADWESFSILPKENTKIISRGNPKWLAGSFFDLFKTYLQER